MSLVRAASLVSRHGCSVQAGLVVGVAAAFFVLLHLLFVPNALQPCYRHPPTCTLALSSRLQRECVSSALCVCAPRGAVVGTTRAPALRRRTGAHRAARCPRRRRPRRPLPRVACDVAAPRPARDLCSSTRRRLRGPCRRQRRCSSRSGPLAGRPPRGRSVLRGRAVLANRARGARVTAPRQLALRPPPEQHVPARDRHKNARQGMDGGAALAAAGA